MGKLTKAISETKKRDDVKIDESEFVQGIGIRVLNKTRRVEESRYLLSEENTRYENYGSLVPDGNNYGSSTSHYTYRSCYEDHKSFSVAISKSRSISLGGLLGGGFMGATLGASLGVSFDKTKTTAAGGERVETKELTAEGDIESGHYIIVRDLEYYVETKSECDLKLKVGGSISYTYSDRGTTKRKTVSVEDLYDKMSAHREVTFDEDKENMYVDVSAMCTASQVEHALEIMTHESDLERAKKNVVTPKQMSA